MSTELRTWIVTVPTGSLLGATNEQRVTAAFCHTTSAGVLEFFAAGDANASRPIVGFAAGQWLKYKMMAESQNWDQDIKDALGEPLVTGKAL